MEIAKIEYEYKVAIITLVIPVKLSFDCIVEKYKQYQSLFMCSCISTSYDENIFRVFIHNRAICYNQILSSVERQLCYTFDILEKGETRTM